MEQNIGRIKAVVNTLTGLLKRSEKGKFEPLSLKLILEETLKSKNELASEEPLSGEDSGASALIAAALAVTAPTLLKAALLKTVKEINGEVREERIRNSSALQTLNSVAADNPKRSLIQSSCFFERIFLR